MKSTIVHQSANVILFTIRNLTETVVVLFAVAQYLDWFLFGSIIFIELICYGSIVSFYIWLSKWFRGELIFFREIFNVLFTQKAHKK